MRPTSWSRPGNEPLPRLPPLPRPVHDDEDDEAYLDYGRPLAYEQPVRSASIVVLLSLVVLCNALGLLVAAVTDLAFYAALVQPPWAPLPEVFAPVWTTLYTLMGIAAWLVWHSPINSDRAAGLGWWAGQLVLNVVWTPIFFGAHQLGAGLIVMVVLFACVLATVVSFWRASKLAAIMMVPYLGWVGFAAVLNAALWWLNP